MQSRFSDDKKPTSYNSKETEERRSDVDDDKDKRETCERWGVLIEKHPTQWNEKTKKSARQKSHQIKSLAQHGNEKGKKNPNGTEGDQKEVGKKGETSFLTCNDWSQIIDCAAVHWILFISCRLFKSRQCRGSDLGGGLTCNWRWTRQFFQRTFSGNQLSVTDDLFSIRQMADIRSVGA